MTEQLLPWQQVQWNKLNIAREQGRLPHALLITGPAGLGKLQFSSLLAKSLVCESPGPGNMPCGSCKQCTLAASESHPDIRGVMPEEAGKQIKIDAIRELVSQSLLAVTESRYRIFILRPVEAMGVAAANALLKTLEEPIKRTLLILISAHPGQLLATIKSRCQQLAFAVPPYELSLDWLSARLGKQRDNSAELLQLARGAPLLAMEMAQSGALQSHNQMLKQFLLLAGNNAQPVMLADEWQKQQDIGLLLEYMKRWTADIILFANSTELDNDQSGGLNRNLQTLAKQLDLAAVYRFMDNLFETERRLANNINSQLALEQLLLHWVHVNRMGLT